MYFEQGDNTVGTRSNSTRSLLLRISHNTLILALIVALMTLGSPAQAFAATTTAAVVGSSSSQLAVTPTGQNGWYVTPGLWAFFNDNSNSINYYYRFDLNPATQPPFKTPALSTAYPASSGKYWAPLAEGDTTLWWYALRSNGNNYDDAVRSRTQKYDPQAPPAPAVSSAASPSQATLTWPAVTDANAPSASGVSQYAIETGSGTPVGTESGTSRIITGLTQGTGYSYRVRTQDVAGNVSGWSTTSFTTPMLTTTASTNPAAGGNGWYTAPVALTLANNGAAGTLQWYSTISAVGPWSAYLAPLNLGEGSHTVYYYAADGTNTETPKSSALLVDTTAPQIGVSGVTNGGLYNTAVAPTFGASDFSMPLSTSATIDGSPFTSGSAVSGEGAHTLLVTSTNAAGLTAESTVNFSIDTVAPVGSMSINNGTAYTSTTGVTANASVTGATQMRYSVNGGSTWTTWESYTADRALTLAAGDGLKTVMAEYRDAAGNVLALSDTITLDTSAPTGTFAINAGAAYSNTSMISANAAITGAADMRYSVNGGSTWTAWESYAAVKALTLPAGDGVKTVMAEYRGPSGAVLALSDTITLDTAAPTGAFIVNNGAIYVITTAVTANAAVTDATQMRYSVDGGSSWIAWEPYAASKSLTLPSGDGLKTVNAEYRDAAGNVLATSESVTLDTAGPTGTMNINGGAAITDSADVTVGSAVTGATQMRCSVNGGSVWSVWEPYAASRAVTLVGGDGERTVLMQYRDFAGNVLALSDTITLDTAAPSGSMSINGGALYTKSANVTVVSDVPDAIELRVDLGKGFGAWQAYAVNVPIVLSSGDGVKTVSVEYRDAALHVLALSDTITLDTVAPTGTFAINSGAAYTKGTGVTANASVTGALAMRYSVDGGAHWSVTESYAPTKALTLPSGDGVKTVLAEYADAAGNVLAISDTITLDTLAPVTTGALTPAAPDGLNGYYVSVPSVTLSTEIGALSFYSLNSPSGPWSPYLSAFTLPEGVTTVFAYSVDSAGWAEPLHPVAVANVDLTAPTGSIAIDGGAAHATSTGVTVNNAASGATEMRFSTNGGTTWSVWEPYVATKAITLPAGDGDKTVTAQFRDGAGNAVTTSDSITLDTAAPGGSMHVGDAETVSTVAQTAHASVTGASEMRYSVDGGAAWGGWVAYADAADITLPAGDGLKTVKGQYRDAAGNVLELTDTVTLDATGPDGSITLAGGAALTATTIVELTCDVTGATQMNVNVGTGFQGWVPFTATSQITLPTGDGLKTVTVSFRDAAGNVFATSDTVTLDTTVPTGSMTVDNGAAYTRDTGVSVNSAVTDATQMRISVDGGSAYGGWAAYSGTAAVALPSGDGLKTVVVQYRDAVGNVLELSDSIVLDATAPAGTFVLNGGAAASSSYSVTGDSDVSGATDMRYSVDGGSTWSSWATYAAQIPVLLPPGEGTKTVLVQYVDDAGNTTQLSDSILVDEAMGTVPVTTITVTGGTTGGGGWYTQAPSVTLASSKPGTTDFSWSSATGPWTPYATALTPAQGTNTLWARSTDQYSNVEDPAVSRTFKVDSAAPAVPSGVAVGATTQGSVQLTWNTSSDGGSGVAEYRVYDADTDQLKTTVTGTSATVSGLTASTNYRYAVSAVDVAGNVSARSGAVAARTAAAPNVQQGTGVQVQLAGNAVAVQIPTVTTATNITAVPLAPRATARTGRQWIPNTYYDISVADPGALQGTLRITLHYSDAGMTPDQEQSLQLIHLVDRANPNTWEVGRNQTIDTAANTISADANSFSDWGIDGIPGTADDPVSSSSVDASSPWSLLVLALFGAVAMVLRRKRALLGE